MIFDLNWNKMQSPPWAVQTSLLFRNRDSGLKYIRRETELWPACLPYTSQCRCHTHAMNIWIYNTWSQQLRNWQDILRFCFVASCVFVLIFPFAVSLYHSCYLLLLTQITSFFPLMTTQTNADNIHTLSGIQTVVPSVWASQHSKHVKQHEHRDRQWPFWRLNIRHLAV